MAALERQCFTLPWSLDQCAGAMTQKAFAAFGAFDGPKLVGYISIYHFAPEMEILNLAVLPAFRRKGVGRRLLRLVLQAGHKMGMQRVSLEVRETNVAALGLYHSLGFTCAGIRRNYYPDNGENAMIEVLELGQNFMCDHDQRDKI